MKSSNIAWALGAITAVSLGMAAQACSSSSTTGGGTSSSTGTSGSSSSKVTTSSSSSSSETIVDGGGSDCHKAPPALHPEDGGSGIYCPFSTAFDSGLKTISCTSGEHCCEPTTDGILSTCSPLATECTNGATDWQCEGTPNCAGTPGTICCGTGTVNTQEACGSVPSYAYISGFKGASCATTCAGYQVCSKDSECPGGAAGTCAPVAPKGNGIGYCTNTLTGASAGGSSSSTASSSAASSSESSGSGSSTASGSSSGSSSGSGS